MSGTKNLSINKKNISLFKYLTVSAALLFCLVVLNFFNSGIRNTFFAFSSPVQRSFWAAGESASEFFQSFLNAGAFAKENQNLKSENQKLLAQVSSMQSVMNGDAALTAVSAACQNDNFKLKMVGVMGLTGQDQLTINQGSLNGISVGMPIINQQKALLGAV